MKMTRLLLFHTALACLTAFSFSAHACPLGQNEQTLTIGRVMRNLGRFYMPTEMIYIKGTNSNEDPITNAELANAADKLNIAITCADAVIKNPSGDLLPSKAAFLSGEALTEYIEDLVYYMTDFKTALAEVRELLGKLEMQSPADRKFEELKEKCQEVDDLINHAHKKL